MPNSISMCAHCRALDCSLADEARYFCTVAKWDGHEWLALDGTNAAHMTAAAPGLLTALADLIDRVEKLERRFDGHEENHASKDYGSEYAY